VLGTSLLWRSTVAFSYLKVKSADAFGYFRWSWSCHFGLGLVSSSPGLGLVTLALILVLRIWSYLNHCPIIQHTATHNWARQIVRTIRLYIINRSCNQQTSNQLLQSHLNTLSDMQVRLTWLWITGHWEIYYSDIADLWAKKAIKDTDKIPTSAVSLGVHKKMTIKQCQSQWQTSWRGWVPVLGEQCTIWFHWLDVNTFFQETV